METPGISAPSVPAATEQDEHVRTRLLNAAVRVFDRKGYAAASVREVAEMAGVTKPAVYYHFGSKEGLLLAILHQAERQLSHTLEQADLRPGSARERIVALCEDVYALFGQHVPLARVAHAVFLGPPDGAPPFDVTVFEVKFRRSIERMVEAGIASGEFLPVATEDVALGVMAMLELCNERQLHPAFEPVGPGVVRRLISLFFDGVMNAPRG
ncbi:MAG: transcriptional regulator, TetR family [Acidobacteria bacterium]|nr:transcriptional regulator, TetR family [Acidobacteriota bacterium]